MKITITVPADKYALVEPILKGLQGLIGKGFTIDKEDAKPNKISRRKKIAEQAKANLLTGSWRKPRV
ncbi:hypothetical protein [Flavobacterium coralii]|uniref:hypothetical protein n=1 Tax=Flavobacterium coralii TaxID=2838017 RepID=UPI000C3FA524|nr:hypothetical protein [Flavobacterium sp.]|tara:strand:+ start:1109 stop:1309 length:201 start_codon:yes stop_codon:yes gene_type:complete